MKPILEVRDLRVYFNTIFGDAKSVDGVSFDVYEKEILGIAGESGCGKSTFVEAALRLIKPPGYIESGKVLFKGVDLLTMKERELRRIRWKELSYIPQGSMNSLNPVLKIEEQIIDGITTHSDATQKEAREMAFAGLSAVGMPVEVAQMYSHELSGGMRQRVCIGMSTSLKPDLILADEPITGLDVIMQRLNLQTLAELRDKHGITIVLVAHDMACHAEICDRIWIMYAGKMVELGTTDQIFTDPLHPYTKGLLEAVPSLEDRNTKSIAGLAPTPLNWPSGCRFHPRCPRVMEICRREEPVLQEKESGRQVRCHLYENSEQKNNG
jgi:peptide/nickel transport system ATP-binding protein